jgi:hypothetical protein
VVTLNANTTVSATFAAMATLTVTRTGAGSGTVTSTPTGIDCGTACSKAFQQSTVVSLFAQASPGSRFMGWSGVGCGKTNPCNVTLMADTSVVATFQCKRRNSCLRLAPAAGETQMARARPTGSPVPLDVDSAGMPVPGSSGQVAVIGDYDGDGQDDVALYSPLTGEWVIRRSSDGGITHVVMPDAQPQDLPVPADYDGDGRTDMAIYRSGTGEWMILRSSDQTLWHVNPVGGDPGDLPVPADYDGDGIDDVAIYRPATGEWFIRGSSDSQIHRVQIAPSRLDDRPVPADYDGDGRMDAAVYRPGTGEILLLRSSDGARDSICCVPPGDVPIIGDYDGAGRAGVAVFPSGGAELTMVGSAVGICCLELSGGDVVVLGDFDGDGRDDVGVYRPSSGEWLLFRSSDNRLTPLRQDALESEPATGGDASGPISRQPESWTWEASAGR